MYLVSTLKNSGPTNQLFNIISGLPSGFSVKVITLSPEESDSQLSRFQVAGIEVNSLALSRMQGLFKAKSKVLQVIKDFNPDIIHSQGIRADALLAKCQLLQPWVITSRNYPVIDYPMKFGKLKGGLMAKSHLAAMKKCQHLISCSKSIATELSKHNLKSIAIQNGVSFSDDKDAIEIKSSKPIFVTVGSLISRKNTSFLINAFNSYRKQYDGSLYILGDGPERAELEALAGEDVFFTGNVSNVRAYLLQADYFLSASLSEGLPNTVLEALAAGLPCLLSDIPSHQEIHNENPLCLNLFSLDGGADTLAEKMVDVHRLFPDDAKSLALQLATGTFSAAAMSAKYQDLYRKLAREHK